MELLERKDANEGRKLPKNVRQIGEPGVGLRVFIEDYVYTYLHQLAEGNLTCIKTAVLVGKVEASYGIYIKGAVEVDMGQEVKNWFSHEHWRDIFKEIQTWFEGQEVVGWYMANPGFPPVLTEELRNIHLRNFSGNACTFFQTDVLDREEIFYLRTDSGLAPLSGYYLYYEKNDKMQAYMSQKRGGVGIEPESVLKDRAAARFRNTMQEKQERNTQKKTMAFLYTSCMFLVMVILVIGITLVNNYDRMSNMESAIHQISESLGEEETPEELAVAAPAEGAKEPASIEEAALQENQEAAKPDTPSSEESTDKPEENTVQAPEGDATQAPTSEEMVDKPEEPPVEAPKPPEEAPQAEEPSQEAQEPEEPPKEATEEPQRYEVKKGDTLLEISRARYGTDDMVRNICELNGLDDGDVIYVGDVILLP